MICCPSAPEAAKTASREARISLFIIFIYSRATCDPVFVVLRTNLKGKGVREIVKGCSLMKPDTSSVTIVWSDEVQAFVIFCTGCDPKAGIPSKHLENGVGSDFGAPFGLFSNNVGPFSFPMKPTL